MEELRISSRILHPEVHFPSRSEIAETLNEARITDPYYTDYEYVVVIGMRTQMLADGASPLVSIQGMMTSDAQFLEKVAKKEIYERKLPFIVHRRMPNGKSEYWSASELSVI
jgi:DNA-directed RNA polymerase subunit K/omega